MVIMEDTEKKDLAQIVRDAIKRRYREEFVIYEFKDLPSNPSHYMDALVINLHPSRSKYIESIEIKTHRSDWLNELKNPDKNDSISKHCDLVWLATSSKDIARIEEIPPNWGWMALAGNRFKIMKQAPKLNPAIDKDFVITVCQYASTHSKDYESMYLERKKTREELKKEIAEEYAKDENYTLIELRGYKDGLQKLKEKVRLFTQDTGIVIDKGGYDDDLEELKETAKIIGLLKNVRNGTGYWDLPDELKLLKDNIKRLEEAYTNYKSLAEKVSQERESLGRIENGTRRQRHTIQRNRPLQEIAAFYRDRRGRGVRWKQVKRKKK